MSDSATLYLSSIRRFRSALAALPLTLPSGSSIYNFSDWSPDPDLLDDYGAECSVLNAHLETVFGLRAQSSLTFLERGPGIESLADVFTTYLTGDFKEKPIIGKWLEDLTTAAEAMSSQSEQPTAKRVSKPSAAQKRSDEWLESTAEASAARKRQKTDAAAKAQQRDEAVAKTAQTCNWKHGFDDLQDVEPDATPYTTGRKGYAMVKELVIKCQSKKTGDIRWRCSSPGCQQSWKSYQPQRLLNHATQECRFIEPDLLNRASEQSSGLSLGEKVAKLDNKTSPFSKPAGTLNGQSSIRSLCSKEGLRAQQARFDFSVINFIAAAQIAPKKVDLPEFHTMISKANTALVPKSSSYIAHCQIPMESCRIRRLAVQELKECRNLTISFDGGTAIRPMSFTTIHVTTPETRVAHLMAGIEASGISHTGKYYFEELEKIINEVGPLNFSGISCDSTGNTRLARELIHKAHPTIIILPDSCHQLHNAVKDVVKLPYFAECRSNTSTVTRYFSKSTMGATHFNSTRQQMGITEGLQKSSKTRFGGAYYSSKSMRRCLPAVEKTVKSGAIEVKKDHPLYFIKNVAACSKFGTQLYQLEKLTKPIAKAIQCLESGHSNPSDVMVFYLAIMASLRQLLDNNDSDLALPEDVLVAAQASVCARYHSMILASGQEVYLATFFLHPQYINSDILRRHNLNPLNTNVIVLPPRHKPNDTPPLPDADIYQAIPAFPKIAVYLKQVFCRELMAGTISAATEYPSTNEGVSTIISIFKSQVCAYARGEHPFVQTAPTSTTDPMTYWKRLLKHPNACFLAPIAVKLFSLVPNSMAEERTVSSFTALNTKERSRQKVSTLVHLTRIRQHLLRERQTTKIQKKPVVKFRDLGATVLKQQHPIASTKVINLAALEQKDLPDGWSVADIEQLDGKQDPPVNGGDEDGTESGQDDSDDEPEPIDDEALGFDPSAEYGINLLSPLLIDLLAETPTPGTKTESSVSPGSTSLVNKGKTKASAKKDISTVNLDEW
ncbi:hypothetical protein FRC08_010296 [Ceratobasidium sp. 394]|nr:hypothetical protein FRC08_010296 [Ceratobasidium sp. 394]